MVFGFKADWFRAVRVFPDPKDAAQKNEPSYDLDGKARRLAKEASAVSITTAVWLGNGTVVDPSQSGYVRVHTPDRQKASYKRVGFALVTHYKTRHNERTPSHSRGNQAGKPLRT